MDVLVWVDTVNIHVKMPYIQLNPICMDIFDRNQYTELTTFVPTHISTWYYTHPFRFLQNLMWYENQALSWAKGFLEMMYKVCMTGPYVIIKRLLGETFSIIKISHIQIDLLHDAMVWLQWGKTMKMFRNIFYYICFIFMYIFPVSRET